MIWLNMPTEINRYYNGTFDIAILFQIPSLSGGNNNQAKANVTDKWNFNAVGGFLI